MCQLEVVLAMLDRVGAFTDVLKMSYYHLADTLTVAMKSLTMARVMMEKVLKKTKSQPKVNLIDLSGCLASR